MHWTIYPIHCHPHPRIELDTCTALYIFLGVSNFNSVEDVMQGEGNDEPKRICFICSKRVSADQWRYEQFKNSMKQFIVCHKCILDANGLPGGYLLAQTLPTIKSPDMDRPASKLHWFIIGYSTAIFLNWLLGLMYPGK